MTASTCRSCGAPVVWVRTEAGRPMPLDPEPTPTGNVIYTDEADRRVKVVGTADDLFATDRYVSHFATCPHAEEHRQR